MSGLRKRPSGWQSVPNSLAEDASLSFRARGILIYLLAKPDGWVVRSAAIAKDGKEGRQAVLVTLRELGAAGYYRCTRASYVVPGQGIRWTTQTEVSAEPVPEWIAEWSARREVDDEESSPESHKPDSGEPDSGEPDSGERDAIPSLTQTKDSRETTSPSPDGEAKAPRVVIDTVFEPLPIDVPPLTAPDGLGTSFDTFWGIYPRKVGKEAARKAWAKAIAKKHPEVILAGVRRFAADPNLPGKAEAQFICHPSTWLNEGRWDDDPLPPRGRNSRDANLHRDEGRTHNDGDFFQ